MDSLLNGVLKISDIRAGHGTSDLLSGDKRLPGYVLWHEEVYALLVYLCREYRMGNTQNVSGGLHLPLHFCFLSLFSFFPVSRV